MRSCSCTVGLVPRHGGRPGRRGLEEDDGGDEFGVCGSEGEGDGPAEGPAANQKARVGGMGRLACEGGVLVRDVADDDDALALVKPGRMHTEQGRRAGDTRVQCRSHRGVNGASARVRVHQAHLVVERSAGVPASVTRSAAFMHVSLTCVVRCCAKSVRTAGRGSCSAAMALGAARTLTNASASRNSNTPPRTSAAYSPKLCLASTMRTTPHAPHRSEHGLQREALERGGVGGGDEAGVGETSVAHGSEGGGVAIEGA